REDEPAPAGRARPSSAARCSAGRNDRGDRDRPRAARRAREGGAVRGRSVRGHRSRDGFRRALHTPGRAGRPAARNAAGAHVGEAVCTTGMSGYQEAVTDPSFEDQLICFTAPMIGNYGVAEARSESARTHARAVLMREARGPEWTDWLREHGIVALTGIDTRS